MTTIHRDLGPQPGRRPSVGYGWTWILDSLKSMLETGEPLAGARADRRRRGASTTTPRARATARLAIDANNSSWELLGARRPVDADEADDLLGRAYTVGLPLAAGGAARSQNAARAAWLLSRAHAVLGHGERGAVPRRPLRRHVAAAGLDDFDLAYAHEARARALACLGRLDEAAAELAAARAVPIADDEDRRSSRATCRRARGSASLP